MGFFVAIIAASLISWFTSAAGTPRSLSSIKCDLCKLIVPEIQSIFEKNVTEDEVAKLIIDICIDFKIEDKNVCISIVPLFRIEVLTVFADVALSANTVCGLLFGSTCAIPDYPQHKWNVSLPKTPKPPVRPPIPPKHGAPVMRILHLSDVHWDALYTPDLDTDCGEPLCCRPPNKYVGPGKGAGKWGSYPCDTPWITLENLLQHINSSVQFDYMYWTGDLPAHNVWWQTRFDQLHVLDTLVKLMLKYFPDKTIFPALGNHESAPVNSYPPPYIKGNQSSLWLFDALAANWSKWLPSDTFETIQYGGYYMVKVRTGWRIISLNINYCQKENFWLFINNTDPAQELAWLVLQLQDAEDAGDKVHILGHQPVSSCMSSWQENYYKIVNRYENTIAGQFFGHTHTDEFRVFYDQTNTSRATSIMYLGPSVTTYQGLNPSFRLYEVDGEYDGSSYYALDHSTYIFNLTEVNMSDKPQWQFEYSVKEAYKMESLYPQDWADFLDRMKTDKALQDLYNKFFHHSHVSESCDAVCRSALMCEAENPWPGRECKSRVSGVFEWDMVRYSTEHKLC